MTKILLEDNEHVHNVTFKLTFLPDDEDDGDETYFPDETDVEHAVDNSMLDTANSYYVEQHSCSDSEAVFMIYVNNEDTDEYMPDEGDIEHAMEYSGAIDEWNRFYAEETSRTIGKAVHRANQLNKIGI